MIIELIEMCNFNLFIAHTTATNTASGDNDKLAAKLWFQISQSSDSRCDGWTTVLFWVVRKIKEMNFLKIIYSKFWESKGNAYV